MNKLKDQRPWGEWHILAETPNYKVKKIVVKPGHRLSYQRHQKRQEHWAVAEGTAKVTLNDELHSLKAGDSIDIPKEAAHRIENEGSLPLTFIELQTGSYFGEDDIERLQDDYGRG